MSGSAHDLCLPRGVEDGHSKCRLCLTNLNGQGFPFSNQIYEPIVELDYAFSEFVEPGLVPWDVFSF